MTICRLAAVVVLVAGCSRAEPARASNASRLPCLRYGPETVTVHGRLVRLVFPGRPNYEDTLRGDEPEPGFYLQVRPALCVRGGRDEELGEPHSGVDSIQLALDSAGYATLRPLLGTRVGLRGSLFPEHTGHHHAPVLLDVVSPVTVVP